MEIRATVTGKGKVGYACRSRDSARMAVYVVVFLEVCYHE
jgi:hypothetical protein